MDLIGAYPDVGGPFVIRTETIIGIKRKRESEGERYRDDLGAESQQHASVLSDGCVPFKV